MDSFSIIAIKGPHFENMSEIFSAFKYVDKEKDEEFRTWNGAVSFLYDNYLEFTKKYIAIRGIWQDGDWTIICDPEMVDVFNEEALEAISRTKNTTVLAFVSQTTSSTYSFAKYNSGKKEREFFVKEGEIMRSIGSELAEELSVTQKNDLIQLAKNFGIELEIKSADKFIVTKLGYSEELMKEVLANEPTKDTGPLFDRGNFVLFKKYPRLEETYQLVELLRENEIPYQIVNNSFSVDLTFGSNPQTEIELKLLKKDFEAVDRLLEQVAEENIKNIPQDHYLYQFSEEELTEIIKKPDEWSKEDYVLAKQILDSKGKAFSKQNLDNIKQERIKDLSTPEGGDSFWTFLGYVFAFGGILGAIIGWHLMNFKKVLPNGERIFNYNTTVRAHGKRIFVISITAIAIWLIIMFTNLN